VRGKKALPVVLALLGGMAGVAVAAGPAQAAGDSQRQYGCAAHWRNTAAWNECKDSPGIEVQLQVDCGWPSPDWYGKFRYVKGSVDYADRHECSYHVESALNAFK
jgi:hypothetical protein